MNEVVAQITPAITACAAAERRPVVLMLLFTTSGRAEAAQWLSDLTDAEHACVHAALERVDLPGDVDEPDSRILRFPSESSRVTVADAVPTTPSPPVSTEDAIRVALDARGDDIVACTDGRPTAVAVAWSAGALTITLRGRAHGSDVEGCVRAVCANLVAPPTGSGSVLHVVHASR